mgnify:CR=1 FL=1
MAKSKPRNYDREYKKFHKSIKAKKKRALLNGLKDCPPGQDNSHVGGKIKCKKGSSNRATQKQRGEDTLGVAKTNLRGGKPRNNGQLVHTKAKCSLI